MFVLWIILIVGAIWLFTGHRNYRYDYRSHDKYMGNYRYHHENKERP